MARRELRQPHLAPLKPHMPAGARIRESDGNPHCRQNPSIASLAYPHAGHDTHRNTAARQTQPGAHPHRTLRHAPPHPVKSQYLCNSTGSQRFSNPANSPDIGSNAGYQKSRNSNHSHGRSSRKKPNRTGFPHLAWEFRHRSRHPPNSPASPIDRPAMRGRGRAW